MSPRRRPARSEARLGLALAGGGPEGAVYEIGALRAIDEACDGLDLNRLDVYVGVSAGSFIASCLANGLTTAQMCRAIVKSEPGEHPFVPETFFTPAVGELARRAATLPGLVAESLLRYARRPQDLTLLESLTGVARALPVGVFDNEPIRRYVAGIFSIKDRSDDFRRLGTTLLVVAADLCAGRAVCFGAPGWDHVPISRAVQASTALPGLYPPVEIEGRQYVDGVLLKTLHASVALERGVGLLLCVNPIVPVDTQALLSSGDARRRGLVARGLPTVLSQTFRTLIHSRMALGMASYRSRFRDADVLLLEPRSDDYEMFFTNIFSFTSRRDVCEHAYRSTRRELLRRREEIEPVLARHGIRLRVDVLEDESRRLWENVGLGKQRSRSAVGVRLAEALDRLEEAMRLER